jgi:hypothetical protein
VHIAIQCNAGLVSRQNPNLKYFSEIQFLG